MQGDTRLRRGIGGWILAVAAVVALGAALPGCESSKSVFPTTGSFQATLLDTGLASQASDNPGVQYTLFRVETLEADIPGHGTFSFVRNAPCTVVRFAAIPLALPSDLCLSTGIVLPPTEELVVDVRARVVEMEVRRAERPDLPDGGDYDGDGIPNEDDNCPLVHNPDQADSTGNGVGDACSVADSTGALSVSDRDGDGVPDASDNCLWIPNEDQADSLGDRIGDACRQVAVVLLPGGVVELEFPQIQLRISAGTLATASIDFDTRATLTCTPSFDSCTLDPTQIIIRTPSI
jgi:hypothetical protein